ncbi:MAG: hypothetical protein FWC02_03385 [Firmicutes bacterium]|nr:hypothetical protein [Bacillota bacterium]
MTINLLATIRGACAMKMAFRNEQITEYSQPTVEMLLAPIVKKFENKLKLKTSKYNLEKKRN